MKIKKILKYSLIVFLVLTILSAVFVQQGITSLYGGKTQEAIAPLLAPQTGQIIINNINILSPNGEEFLNNHSISIQEGVITAIDTILEFPKNAIVIDGKGKYLIPGLIDSHVHLFKSPNDLLLYVANGVTQVREMIGEESHLEWKAEITQGRIGPELYLASPRFGSFDFGQGLFMVCTQGFINVNTAEEATEAVQEYHRQGYDGIKIYSHLNQESYQAISTITESLGMDMIGHIPFNIGLADVWQGKQREIAHFEEIMNALNREYGYFRNEEKEKFYEFIDEKSDSVAYFLKRNNIAVTSTIWGMNSLYRQKTDLQNVLSEIELAYVNPGITEGHQMVPEGGLGWLPDVNRVRFPANLTEEEQKGRGDYWLIYAEACERVGKNLQQRGVNILAGTDANLAIKVPGFSLHDELISLNKMGMTPAETLRSATLNPAKWLNNNAGQIKKGLKANLVILDKNPLEKMEHTKAINSVILQGRVLDRTYLDKLLLLVKQANDASRNKTINEFVRSKK